MNASQFRLLRTLAVRGLALGLLAAGTHVFAQTAPAAKSDPRVLMGGFHPERMQPTTLAPHVAPVIVTPPENIPLNRLQAQPGFQIELWAHGSPGARMMTRGDKGTVFQGTRNIGRVYAIYEKDGKHVSKIIVEKLVQPNGVLFHKGSLYVVAINRVLRYDNIEANLENIPAPVDMTEDFKLPPEVHHNITTGDVFNESINFLNRGRKICICKKN